MEIKTKLYPYPVLTSLNDDYVGSSFISDANVFSEGANLHLKLNAVTNNADLKALIESGVAKYLFHIECVGTGFRKAMTCSDTEIELNIPQKNLRGKLQICSFIIAVEDIVKYSCRNFHEDYRGFMFTIDAGCVMAVGSQFEFNIETQIDDFMNTPSIFGIVKNSDENAVVFSVSMDNDKIVVTLPQNDYANYRALKSNAYFKSVLNGLIILPALVYVLEEICSMSTEERADRFSSRRWYRALKKAVNKMNLDIESPELSNNDMLELSQKMIGQPTSDGLNALRSGYDEEE